MFPLFESIYYSDGIIRNPDLHLERINRSRKEYLNSGRSVSEREFIDVCNSAAEKSELHASRGKDKRGPVYKIKFFYNESEYFAEAALYTRKKLRLLKAVHCDNLDYSFKLTDRSGIENLLKEKGEADDIIIIKNGLVTDSSFGNLVFENEEGMFTPVPPLLKGTMREYLLRSGLITEARITISDISKFRTVHNINAMNLPGEQCLPASSIIYD